MIMGISYLGKSLFIEEMGERILVIGDLHLGYEENLNKSGVFISRKMFEEMLLEMDKIFAKIEKVDKIILLGDVKHDFGGILKQEWNDVLGLIEYLKGKLNDGGEIIIVKGNHDNYLKNIALKEGVKVCDYFVLGKYAFLHGDKDFNEIWERRVTNWIVGHGHPAIKLGDGVKVEKYKCFLVGRHKGREVVIVPSFFEYFAGSDPRESDYDMGFAWKFNLKRFKVMIVGEREMGVRDFGVLGEL